MKVHKTSLKKRLSSLAWHKRNVIKNKIASIKFKRLHKDLLKKAQIKWRMKNKKKLRLWNYIWRHNNLERVRNAGKIWKLNNPMKNKQCNRNWLLKKYGLTEKKYIENCLVIKNRCEVCYKPPNGKHKRLCVDHDHKTGKARGLLCLNCNSGLGHLMDSPIIIKSLLKYILKHQGE